MPRQKKKLCFVIMPFQESMKEVYWKAISPACQRAGYKSLRVDELEGVFNINRKIIENIFNCDAIVADLTHWRPNVFYEMGVAHAIGNKTIMIIQEGQHVPFDISTYNCIQYVQTESGLDELARRIETTLSFIQRWCKQPTNPVQEFKPFNAITPKAVLDEMQEKDKLLKNSIPKSEWESLNKELDKLRIENFKLQNELEYLRVQTSQSPQLELVQSSSFLKLRSEPLNELSEDEVMKMLKEKNFFDIRWNNDGKGIRHQYEVIQHDGARLIIDRTTGLTWQQSGSHEGMIFDQAYAYVRQLNQEKYCGYNGWRLPTLEEAMSLVERDKKNGELYTDTLFDRTQLWIWTGDKQSVNEAWVVPFYSPYCFHHDASCYVYVRAVH